jgi:hypothetical protein
VSDSSKKVSTEAYGSLDFRQAAKYSDWVFKDGIIAVVSEALSAYLAAVQGQNITDTTSEHAILPTHIRVSCRKKRE